MLVTENVLYIPNMLSINHFMVVFEYTQVSSCHCNNCFSPVIATLFF